MKLFQRSPGRLPEIIGSLSATERVTLLDPIRILFCASASCIWLSSLPILYLAFFGQFNTTTVASAFGVTSILWFSSFALHFRIKRLLVRSRYAIENRISVRNLRGAYFGWYMLQGNNYKPNKAEIATPSKPSDQF